MEFFFFFQKDLEGIGNAIIAKEVESDERREQFEKLAATVTDGTLIIAQIIHVSILIILFSYRFLIAYK